MDKHLTTTTKEETVLYHGTVEAYVPAILKHGLKETEAHTWKIHFDNDIFGARLDPEEKTEGVYLTPEHKHAEQYAQTKANYLHQQPGAEFMLYGSNYVIIKKDADAPVIETKPVIVKVTIPKGVKGTWDRDHEDSQAIRYFGVIQPEYITLIEPLEAKYDPQPLMPKAAAAAKNGLMSYQLGPLAELFGGIDAGN